jgi:hypothetical protein
MKNRKGILNFQTASGLKPISGRAHSGCSGCCGLATVLNWLGWRGPHGMTGRRTWPTPVRSTRSTRRAQSACHATARGGYPTAKLHTADESSDGAPPSMAWPEAEVVNRPRRGPHGAQHVALAVPVTTDDWTTREKMSTGSIHGSRCT